jgi:predicted nucleic acid-binding protein
MERKGYLIDTNVIIDYVGEILPNEALDLIDSIINGHFFISVINQIELLGFSGITQMEELKFQEFIDASLTISLTHEVIDKTIQIRKKYRIKLPDAIIAAIALVHGLTLLTRNTKDFERIEEIAVSNPYYV